MLRWRLISAAVVLSILISLLVCDYQQFLFHRPGVWLIPLVLIACSLAVGEVLDFLKVGDSSVDSPSLNLRPLAWTTHLGTFAIIAAACAPIAWADYPLNCPLGRLGWPLLALAGGMILAFVGEMLRYREPGGVVIRLALGIFTMVYVGVLAGFLVHLRLFQGNQWGMAALVSTIVVVKMSDTGAYAFGRAFGRHPMTPRLSPKKTIEGGAGGIIASMLAAWLVLNVVTPRLIVPDAPLTETWRWMTLGGLLAIVAMIGDLAESLIKRDMGRKDSSSWLPGLGGVLDILDSLLFAAPVAYACWAVGLVGPLA